MKSWFVRVESGVVAMTVLAACSSTDGIGSGHFIDVESVDGGKRLRVEGVFEITAPIAVWTDGGILFESTSSRRDVVFVDRIGGDPEDPRVRDVGMEFHLALSQDELKRLSTRAQAEERDVKMDVSDVAALRPISANHVRIRKAGRERWLIDVIDTAITGEPESDTTCSMHFDYDASRK